MDGRFELKKWLVGDKEFYKWATLNPQEALIPEKELTFDTSIEREVK